MTTTTSKGESRFYRVTDGIATVDGPTVYPGDLLELVGPRPRTIEDLVRAGALVDLGREPLGRGVLVRRIVAEAFAPAPRPEPAEPEYVERRELLRRLGWTDATLQAAARFDFPAPARQTDRYLGASPVPETLWLWNMDQVHAWRARASAFAATVV